MSNPSRAKGTRGENYWLMFLRALFYPSTDIDAPLHFLQRAPLKGTDDRGDFTGVPWIHEAKNTAKPLFLQWARRLRLKAGDDWVLLWKGDMRSPDGQPLVVMTPAKYAALVRGDHLQ